MNRTLLLIDDSVSIHRFVASRLAGASLDIHSAYDGDSGIRMAKELRPDLILLDISMPGQSGQDVCRLLKTDPTTRLIPIIFLTGVDSSEQVIRGLDTGAVDYVTKPFDPGELLARIRSNLRTKDLVDGLRQRALIDPLTTLWNRRYFDDRLRAEQASMTRSGQAFCCIMIDIDHFKAINDKFGHTVGDDVLKQVAHAVRNACRPSDIVCRYGGEEIVMFTPQTAVGEAVAIAERVRQAVAELRIVHQGQPVPVTCSVGVAEEHQGFSIVERADAALYQAKYAGRNRVIAA